MIHQRKDIVIESDTIRLIRVFMFQQADIVWTTIKDVDQTSSYERQWKVNITTHGVATIVAAREVDWFPKNRLKKTWLAHILTTLYN